MKKGLAVGTIITLTLIVLWLIKPWNSFSINKTLTEEEIKATIYELYEGEVVSIKLLGDEYLVKLRSEKGIYRLKLDSQSGDITSLIQTEKTPVTEEIISEEQVNEIILSKTDGEIKTVDLVEEKAGTVYKAVITKGKETFNMTVDAVTGTIISYSPEKAEEIAKSLTVKQAGEIALEHVNGGKIDDIELKKNNQTTYYLVEIEFENEREANVQVNAISGEVMSVVWDD